MNDEKTNWNNALEKAKEVEAPIEQVNQNPPVEKMKFNYLKVMIFVIISFLVTLGVVVSVFINNSKEVERGAILVDDGRPIVVVNESSVSESTKENLVINPVDPVFPINESTDSSKKNNTDPVIVIKNPVIAQSLEYNTYAYSISVNEPASIKYSHGFTYDIDVDNCKEAQNYYSDSDLLSESITNPMFGDNTVIIKVNRVFLNDSTLVPVAYELKDLEGVIISRGTVGIPNCKGVVEVIDLKKGGKFHMEGPEVVDSKTPGYSNYKYVFYPDDVAKNFFEKGFTSKIYHNCDSWLVDDPMYKKWEAGKMGYLGINFDIDNDAIDTGNPFKKSVYEIKDNNGKLLFQGYVSIPNCR